MNTLSRLLSLSGAALIALSACGRKVDAHLQADGLEKLFQAGHTNVFVNIALTAVRTNDYAAGVISLQSARRMPGMTAEQLMAVQRTLEAMTTELVARAAKGDVKAQADLAAIERSRSQ